MKDTTVEAESVWYDILRSRTGSERVAIALELSQMVRDLQLSGLRARHPEWAERDVLVALMRQIYAPAELPPDLR